MQGKIIVWDYDKDSCSVYIDSDSAKLKFKTKNDSEAKYNSFTWMNTEDLLLCTESIPHSNLLERRSNIIKVDISGRLIEKIYEAKKGEIAWMGYPSKDDKRLIFTTHQNMDSKQYPFEGLAPMASLIIMDLEKKSIIKKMDSIGRYPNFKISESPWLKGNSCFIYSISEGNKIVSEGKVVNPINERKTGIYIYDIDKEDNRLIIPNGYYGIVSPVTDQIAFLTSKSLNVLDLTTNLTKTIYELASKERIRDIHWTPDGKNIYVASYLDKRTKKEKLINTFDGKYKYCEGIKLGFRAYSWK